MRHAQSEVTTILGVIRAKFLDIISIRVCHLRFLAMLLRKINNGLGDTVNICRLKSLFTTYQWSVCRDDLVEMLMNSAQVLVMGPLGVQLGGRFQSHALLIPEEGDFQSDVSRCALEGSEITYWTPEPERD